MTEFHIGDWTPSTVYIIAEAGLAHLGSEDLAMLMVDQAADSGADAVKFQAFSANTLYPTGERREQARRRELKKDVFPRLKDRAERRGIDLLVTPHDDYGLMIVRSLDLPAIKIGSGEKGNRPFIERIMEAGKPLIVSTGMHGETDIDDLQAILGDHPHALMHCVSAYPATEVNLARIWALSALCEVVGYSDHSGSVGACGMAVAAGARILEFHFHPGVTVADSNDGLASFDAADIAELVDSVRSMEVLLGTGSLEPRDEEKATEKWALKDSNTNCRIDTLKC